MSQPALQARTSRPTALGSRRSVLLVLAALLAAPLLSVVAFGLWGMSLAKATLMEQRRDALAALSETLAPTAGVLIEHDEVTRLRTLVAATAREHDLARCAVILSDGRVLADSDPNRITVQQPPATWQDAAAPRAPGTDDPELLTHSTRFDVPEHGTASLLVAAHLVPSAPQAWPAMGLLGAISLVAAVGLLAIHRWAISILRPLGAIQGALRARARGETSLAALGISPRWGPEAAAWNAFLADQEALNLRLLDHRHAETSGALRTGDSMIERACDTLNQGLIVVDSLLKVRYANGAAAVLLQTKKPQMPGRALADLVKDEPVLSLAKSVADKAGRRRGSVEVDRHVKDERSVLRFSATRASQDGGFICVLIEDLTQQRVADKARDAFVTHATHELRTPLTNILLYIETLQEDGQNDPAVRGKCINVINQETRRLERMVNDMLSVSEIEAGSLKLMTDDVRLDAVFEELRADYEHAAAEKKITLTFDLPPKLPVIRGDRDKLLMALHNLVGNAIKYTPAGGSVAIKIEASESNLVVRVSDTGIGIAPEDAARIFEKFYRAKDRRIAKIPGTGLGLTLAREVIRLHGGDITVESQMDRGSTFTLSLPTSPSATGANFARAA